LDKTNNYLLITSAYNEEKYIKGVLDSVISQTCLPVQWIIVSDGSTDKTDEIIRTYSAKYPFITYIRYCNPDVYVSNLGRISKRVVACIQESCKHISTNDYQFIGILDADVTLEPETFEKLLMEFSRREILGLAGGFIFNVSNNKEWPYFTNRKQVGGPLQLFRRKCWDEIGGLYPGGHHDYFAVLKCKMTGWEVESFPYLRIEHHKHASVDGRSQIEAKFHLGQMDYVCGELFVYALLRALLQFSKKPYIIGSFLRIAGFIHAFITGAPQQIPGELKGFHRKEQLKKLTQLHLLWRRGNCFFQ